jgi:hypothetical protein
MFTAFICTLSAILALFSALFPHMSGAALAVLVFIALPLTAVGVCKLTFLCGNWPWYDTLIAALWIASEADSCRVHMWPSGNNLLTSILVLSAILRWVAPALRRRQARAVTTFDR